MDDMRLGRSMPVDTGRSVSAPPPMEAAEVQRLLNEVAGYERVRTSGDLDGETRGALAAFQASAGLPESGKVDAATTSALRHEAARSVAARQALMGEVDQAIASYNRATRGPLPMSTRGLSGAALGAAVRQGNIEMRAAGLRILHGIPEERTTRWGRHVDGWVAYSNGDARRIGLVAQGELLVETSAANLAAHPDADRATARGLEAARDRYGRIDAPLVLAVAARETRGRVFEGTRGRVNTFLHGGLDSLAAHLHDRTLFAAHEVERWHAGNGDGRNEHHKTIRMVDMPRADQIRAYAGAIEAAWRRVETAVREELGPEAGQRALDGLHDDARRMSIQIAFGAPGGVRYRGVQREYGQQFGLNTVLGRLRARCGARPVDLERIVDPDRFLDQYHVVRRARVTSAEASLFETALGQRDEGGRS